MGQSSVQGMTGQMGPGPIDPSFAEFLSQLPPLGAASLRPEDLPANRAKHAEIQARLNAGVSNAVERSDRTIPGDPPLSIRIHRPKLQDRLLPCIYWMHGGGYIRGSRTIDDLRFDRWCQQFECVAVSVEYRLAPEDPYPAPLDDCYAGLMWIYAHSAELGVEPTAIGVGGASAGGGLAAALTLLARDRAEIPVAFQLLVYPMLDDRQITPSSQWDVPVWGPGDNEFGWRSYLGPAYGGDEISEYAVPARATDLSRLPPALITVGALDGFADESISYAQRLNQAGVPTELHVYPGAPHGFDYIAPESKLTTRFRRDTDEWLECALGAPSMAGSANSALA